MQISNPPGLSNPLTTLGDLFSGGAAGAPKRLGLGAVGQMVGNVGGVLGYAAGFTNPMTTLGDLIVGAAGGAATRLALGGANTVLGNFGGVIAYGKPTGSGLTWPL